MTYDCCKATAEQIEAVLAEAGARLGNGWAERLRRGFVHYTEECEIGQPQVGPLPRLSHVDDIRTRPPDAVRVLRGGAQVESNQFCGRATALRGAVFLSRLTPSRPNPKRLRTRLCRSSG